VLTDIIYGAYKLACKGDAWFVDSVYVYLVGPIVALGCATMRCWTCHHSGCVFVNSVHTCRAYMYKTQRRVILRTMHPHHAHRRRRTRGVWPHQVDCSLYWCERTEDAIQPEANLCHPAWKEPWQRTISRASQRQGATFPFSVL